MSTKLAITTAAALMLSLGGVSAQTAAPGTPATTPAVPPAAAVDCAAEFTRLDVDGDGYISESESASAHARARLDNVTIAEQGIAKDTYLGTCDAGGWTPAEAEEGAPFEGANSFTEEQAKDRALASGVSDITELSKDDKGIWRGKGMHNGGAVNVAVDYKGNVVATAP